MRIRFSPLFLILAALLTVLGQGALTASCLFALLLHEGGHALVARRYGYRLDTIRLMPYGAQLDGELSGILPREEIWVACAGPAVSIFLGLLGVAVWWLFPESYPVTEPFVTANASVGLVNLLPVYPMDGGRVLQAALTTRMHAGRARRIVGWIGLVVALLFSALFLVGMFFGVNFTLASIVVFMLASAVAGVKGARYETLLSKSARNGKKGVRVRMTALSFHAPLLTAIKAADGKHYEICVVLDDENAAVAVADEARLLRWAMVFPPETPLKEIVSRKKIP